MLLLHGTGADCERARHRAEGIAEMALVDSRRTVPDRDTESRKLYSCNIRLTSSVSSRRNYNRIMGRRLTVCITAGVLLAALAAGQTNSRKKQAPAKTAGPEKYPVTAIVVK